MKHEKQPTAETEKNRPVSEVRCGMIVASIWANPVQDSVRYNVTFTRLHHDDSVWQRTDSYGRDDLMHRF